MAEDRRPAVLKELNLPGDLKKLDYAELDSVAAQVRKLIIDVVSENGGHLAPSLGVVELTIALLRCYDPDADRIIWDVGHQSYAYKILTDRLASFPTLRKFGGLSGFSRPSESPYDVCVSGHTSVSVSTALGVAVGDKILGRSSKTVAVIGDGAMSGGLAFEALNNLGELKKNMVVILNDNEMSINRNVGAIAGYLSGILTGEFLTRMKKDVQNIFEDAPLGDKFISFAKKVESSFVGFFTPGSFFENLGIKYIGPVNGHKIKDIERAINNGLLQDGPSLIHVATIKGRGYAPAEKYPDVFHGVSSFDAATGARKSSGKRSWTDVFSDTISRMAEKDPRVTAVTAAMTDGAGLKAFAEKFPGRFFDVGIAEQHAVAFSSGLATSGMKPYVAIYSTFLQRAFDQIIHDVAIGSLPVTFCIDRAGIVGPDGCTHHGAFDISYMRLIPNIAVMLPKDGHELEEMLGMSLSFDFPAAIRYPRGEAAEYPELKRVPVEYGRAEVVKRGSDIAVVSAGHIFSEALALCRMIEDAGLTCTLINLRFLRPLDVKALAEELKSVKLVVTYEEGAVKGGAGEEIQSAVCDAGLNVRVLKFGLPDGFVGHGSADELRRSVGLDAGSVFKKIIEIHEKN